MTERPPQLVLMPGMDGSGELFRGLSAQLSSAMQAQVMRYPAEQWLSYQGLAEVVRHQLQAERPMELVALPLPGSLVRWLLLGDEAPQSLVDAFREAVDWVLPQVLAARVRQVLMTNVLAELAQVRVPILYLQGTEDRLLNQECLLEARAVMPGRTVAIRAPHMLLQCEPKACADLIVEFARGLV
jgi:pimeloyl-[acyl-carrier protein] methyl ester esterase